MPSNKIRQMRLLVLAVLGLSLAVVGCEIVAPTPPPSLQATIQAHNVQATVRAAVVATLTIIANEDTATASPSAFLTSTPARIPTSTSTSTPVPTSTPLPTPTSTTAPQVPKITVTLLGCNTGFDISQGMGEVTNAYATIRNVGEVELTDVCATLSASDEGRAHRDKTRCVGYLPPGYEVSQRLTVDTEYRKLTSITVAVTTTQGASETDTRASCREIAKPLLDQITQKVGVIKPVEK